MDENQPIGGENKEQEVAKTTRGGRVASEIFEFIWETVKVVIVALLIILPVRYYLIQPFFVKGLSMFPNFHDKEYILVDKWTYRTSKPHRGDVIVFRAPTDPNDFFIKRIIGLPGERVVIRNDEVRIYNEEYPDGFVVDEELYLASSVITAGTIDRTLGSEEYFVMGDNREHSSDSRAFGPVMRDSFAGIAWLRLWPPDRLGFIDRAVYPPVIVE